MSSDLLFALSFMLLTTSPLLLWLTPKNGKLRLGIVCAKVVVTVGWELLVVVFIYYNFFVTHLNPWDEKLLVSLFFIVAVSPMFFWLGNVTHVALPDHVALSKIITCFKGALSFGWLVALAILFYLNVIFSPLDLAVDQVVSQRDSPDNAYSAAVIYRAGGATVNNTTLVVIQPKDESIDSKHDQVLFQMDGISSVNLVWMGANKLVIQHESGGSVYTQLPNWHNIVITYSTQ